MNYWKVYFLAFSIQNVQNVTMVAPRDSNVRSKRPCTKFLFESRVNLYANNVVLLSWSVTRHYWFPLFKAKFLNNLVPAQPREHRILLLLG